MKATLRIAAITVTAVLLPIGMVGCQTANRVADASGSEGGVSRSPAQVAGTSHTRQVSGEYSAADENSRFGGTSIGNLPAGRRESKKGAAVDARTRARQACSNRPGG